MTDFRQRDHLVNEIRRLRLEFERLGPSLRERLEAGFRRDLARVKQELRDLQERAALTSGQAPGGAA